MAESGVSNIDTTISFDLGAGDICEPISVLVQEALGQIGIKNHHQQGAGPPTVRSEMAKKSIAADGQLLLRLARLSGIFLLLVLLRARNAIFNNAELCQQGHGRADRRRGAAAAAAVGDQGEIPGPMSRASSPRPTPKLPRIPAVPAVPQRPPRRRTSSGYVYWFHRQVDYRSLVKA